MSDRLVAVQAAIHYAGSQGYPRSAVTEAFDVLDALVAERDEARRELHVTFPLVVGRWQDRAEAAEARVEQLQRERDEVRQACEKAIRERRSLEQKEDDWHSAYERSQARVEQLERELDEVLREAAFHKSEYFNVRTELEQLEAALRGLYDFLPRWSCKSYEPDGCPVCVAKAALASSGSEGDAL